MGMDERVKETARKLFKRQAKGNHILLFVEGIGTHNSYALVGRGRPAALTELAPEGSLVQCVSYKVTKNKNEAIFGEHFWSCCSRRETSDTSRAPM